jgi:hypothetical protein
MGLLTPGIYGDMVFMREFANIFSQPCRIHEDFEDIDELGFPHFEVVKRNLAQILSSQLFCKL